MDTTQENIASKYPKITVVTPNFNQGEFIERTICSILDQGYPNLEYIIIDGLSTDESVDIIKKYAERLSYWESSKDRGMYDAINKGFSRSTGEIMCWINSDDIHRERSLFKAAALFMENPKVEWLMGYPTLINQQDEVIWQGQDAAVHSPYFFYTHRYVSTFSFIQQESTFWRRSLWDIAGGCLDDSYKYGADYDLWLRFYKYEKLYFTNKQLGAFRIRPGQLSENRRAYIEETKLSVKNNYRNLSIQRKTSIIFLKSIRKMLFMSKIKYFRKLYYSLEDLIYGQPKWID